MQHLRLRDLELRFSILLLKQSLLNFEIPNELVMHLHFVANRVLQLLALIEELFSEVLCGQEQVRAALRGNLHGILANLAVNDDFFKSKRLPALQNRQHYLLGLLPSQLVHDAEGMRLR